MLLKGLEVCQLDPQQVLTLLCLVGDLTMVLPRIFSAEVLEEMLEGMLEMTVGALDESLLVEVLVGEVNALSVHCNDYASRSRSI